MVEIVYRIYEVADEKTAKENTEKDFEFGLEALRYIANVKDGAEEFTEEYKNNVEYASINSNNATNSYGVSCCSSCARQSNLKGEISAIGERRRTQPSVKVNIPLDEPKRTLLAL